jgi:hypothetical protein
LDLQQISMGIGSRYLHGTAHTRAAVSSRGAVSVVRGSSTDEAGEDAVNDGVAVGIWAWLEARVSDVRLAVETELLGEIVSGFVGGIRH